MNPLKSMCLLSNFNLLCSGLFYLKDGDTFSLIWFFVSLTTSLLLIIKELIFITYYFFEKWKIKIFTHKENKLKIELFLTQQVLHEREIEEALKKAPRNGKIYGTGHVCWFKDDVLHRENDLPAIEWHNGCKVWYWYGQKHRENGPALTDNEGFKQWWIHGTKYSEEEFKLFSEKKKLNESLNNNLGNKQKNNRHKI